MNIHKNISYLPFLREGQRSVWSNASSPSKPSVDFCLLLSQHLHETLFGWVLLFTCCAADGYTALSQFPAGGNQHLEEAMADKWYPGEDARKMLLGTYSILRHCCPHTLNVSVQSPGGQRGGRKKKNKKNSKMFYIEMLYIVCFTACQIWWALGTC